MKRALQGVVGLCTLCLSSSVWAQSFGKRGTVAVSAERLFGYVHDSYSWQQGNYQGSGLVGQNVQSQADSLSLFTSTLSGQFNAPRIGADYFVFDRVSLGAGLGYASVPQEADRYIFAPRVGYAAMFNDSAGVWPRAGFSYVSASDFALAAITLEAPLVLSPVSHTAILVGPTIDKSFPAHVYGQKLSELSVGIQAGLMIYL